MQQWNPMPKRTIRIFTGPILIVQLNVNCSPEVMTVMQHKHLHNADILHQEPAFSRSKLPQHLFLTPKIPGFTTILPIPINQLRTPPANQYTRVMAYACKQSDVIVVLRYDICLDYNRMVIKVQQWPQQPVFRANIHNPLSGSIGAHPTGQWLRLLNLPETCATIIAGDINLHHPDWEEMTTEPTAAGNAMAEWLQGTSYSLLNVCPYSEHKSWFTKGQILLVSQFMVQGTKVNLCKFETTKEDITSFGMPNNNI